MSGFFYLYLLFHIHFTTTYRYGGEIITVTGRIINGVFNINDAWVNRR